MKYIYHHLGMGDHISCHGIVRYYCELNDNVGLFVKRHNYENVKFMYNDLINLHLFQMDDNEVRTFVSENKIEDIVRVGRCVGGDKEKCKGINFEEDFYLMADVPIEYKTKKFHINRDLNKEMELFKNLGLKENEYIFLHDSSNDENTYLKNIPNDIQIIKPIGHGLFDWMYVIENAKEIHCIDSSFICLIDCMELNDKPLYNHRYVRNYISYLKLFTHKKWNIIE